MTRCTCVWVDWQGPRVADPDCPYPPHRLLAAQPVQQETRENEEINDA